jgi:hypothetical protein
MNTAFRILWTAPKPTPIIPEKKIRRFPLNTWIPEYTNRFKVNQKIHILNSYLRLFGVACDLNLHEKEGSLNWCSREGFQAIWQVFLNLYLKMIDWASGSWILEYMNTIFSMFKILEIFRNSIEFRN